MTSYQKWIHPCSWRASAGNSTPQTW